MVNRMENDNKKVKPRLIVYLPRQSKTDGHLRGLYICPECSSEFISRADRIRSGKVKGCKCRSKKAFLQMIDLSIGKMTTKNKRLVCQRAANGESPAELAKEFGLKHVAIIHELQRRNAKGHYSSYSQALDFLSGERVSSASPA